MSWVDRVEVGICPPFLALWAMVDSARGSGSRCSRRTCARGRGGRVHRRGGRRRCWPRSAYKASCSGIPSAAELFCETDRALAQKVPAALDAGLLPILCVGETEDERESGETERKLRHQIQEDLSRGWPPGGLGDVVIAYEPIWAIGTGLVATPEQAQDAIAFIRALVGDRDREQSERTRIVYGGMRQARERGRIAPRSPTSTARSSAAASLDAASFAGDHQRGRLMADRARARGGCRRRLAVLIVLDGWGLEADGPGNAVSQAGHAGVRRAAAPAAGKNLCLAAKE